MVRVAVLADCHIDASPLGVARVQAWQDAGRLVLREAPEAVIIAGDLFDSGTPDEGALRLAANELTAMAKAGIAVAVIAGNYEWFGAPPRAAGEHCSALAPLAEIVGVEIFCDPDILSVHWCDLKIALLPWPRPSETFAHQDIAAHRLAGELAGWDGPRICVAHASLVEAVGMDGTSGQARGWEPAPGEAASLSALDQPDVFTHTSLGHVHGRQNLTDTCSYVGTIEAFGFHDVDEPHRFSIFEWDPSRQRWTEDHVPVEGNTFVTVAPFDDLGEIPADALVDLSLDGQFADKQVIDALGSMHQGGIRLLSVDEVDLDTWFTCTKLGVRIQQSSNRHIVEELISRKEHADSRRSSRTAA